MKKTVYVKGVPIGGDNPVTIQSMTNTNTMDTKATFAQAKELFIAGADMVRVSFPTLESTETMSLLLELNKPIIGDIHFDHKIAIRLVEKGIAKIRLNPSNLTKQGIIDVVKCCKERNVPIRIGVNKGSVKNNDFSAQNMADLAYQNAKMIEDMGYDKLVLAVKSSDVKTTIEAYRHLSQICDYPLHIGLTESGTKGFGTIKSAVAIGSLLIDGIGDTIRVSLATNPIEEIYTAKKILRAIGIDKNFVNIIACPTCSRTNFDVESIATKLEKLTENITKPIKIAVMGCIVNGIGESQGAKLGVAGGKDKSSIFVDGKVIKVVENDKILQELVSLLEVVTNE